MSRKLYAITTGDYDDYRILGLCSSKKAVNNIVEHLMTSSYVDDVRVEVYDDLFFLRDNTYKPYKVQFSTVSDGERDIFGGVTSEADFESAMLSSEASDDTPNSTYVFAHDPHEAVRHALKMLENCPKARLTSTIS